MLDERLKSNLFLPSAAPSLLDPGWRVTLQQVTPLYDLVLLC